jgi:hypothetical protein
VSSSETRAEQAATRSAAASARLGSTLRDVLLAPANGFAAASKAIERRSRTGSRPAEGIAPYVLTAIGGAALASLWLKVGALAGIRHVCSDNYLVANIVAALILGAVVALLAHSLWGLAGAPLLRRAQIEIARPELRAVWGLAALPQAGVVGLLLPLDLIIIGTRTFMTTSLDDSLSTAWAALSIAFAISLAVWSVYLFVTGIRSFTGGSWRGAAIATGIAIVCVGVVIGALALGSSFLPEARGCPTRRG